MLFDAPVAQARSALPRAGKRGASERKRRDDRTHRQSGAAEARLSAGPGRQLRRARHVLASSTPISARAAEIVDGPLLIVAGPGSGKTRTLTHRIAHLVAERGVPAAKLPRHHVHAPRRRRDARAARAPAAGRRASRSRSTPSTRSASSILREHPSAAGLSAASASRARPSASRCSPRRSTSREHKAETPAARDLARRSARRAGRAPSSPTAVGAYAARARAAQLDRLRRSDRPRGARAGGRSGARRALSRALPLHLGRRIPGRRRAAIPAARAARAARRATSA